MTFINRIATIWFTSILSATAIFAGDLTSKRNEKLEKFCDTLDEGMFYCTNIEEGFYASIDHPHKILVDETTRLIIDDISDPNQKIMDEGWHQVLLARLYEDDKSMGKFFLEMLEIHAWAMQSIVEDRSFDSRDDCFYLKEILTPNETVESFWQSGWKEIHRQIEWYSANQDYFDLFIMHRLLYDIALITDFALQNPIGDLKDPYPHMKIFYKKVYQYFTKQLPNINLKTDQQLHILLNEEFGNIINKIKSTSKRKYPIIPIINGDGFIGIHNFTYSILQDYFLIGYGHQTSPVHAGVYKSFAANIRHDYMHIAQIVDHLVARPMEIKINNSLVSIAGHHKRYFYDNCRLALNKAKKDYLDPAKKRQALRAIVTIFFFLHESPINNTFDFGFSESIKNMLKNYFTFSQPNLLEQDLLDETLIEDPNDVKEAMFRSADIMSLFQQFDPEFYYEHFARYGYKNDNGTLTWDQGPPTIKRIAEIKLKLVAGLHKWWTEFWTNYGYCFFRLDTDDDMKDRIIRATAKNTLGLN